MQYETKKYKCVECGKTCNIVFTGLKDFMGSCFDNEGYGSHPHQTKHILIN